MEELETLNEFRKINASFPYTEPIRRWKDGGGKVVAWMCSYVPEEIIHAAGVLPVRLSGGSKKLALDESAAYLGVGTCTFIRHCFELVLTHQFDFMDAFITANTCEGTRHMAEVWAHYCPTPLLGILPVPRKFGKRALGLYHKELVTFKQVMEGFFGVTITDEALRKAIQVYDEGRNLVRELYDLRKAETPPISGAETLEVLNAGFRMPREDFNQLLRKLLGEIRQSKRAMRGSVRLMISGSVLNNPEFISGIEDLGALVVVDELCSGTRYWYEPVD
ncbi:MAG: 2-hydroxyacyl-CoA dehydratase family protein, partial [bacterium]|nr:2-hydroxyacyl-CoA dehydratase family protein [bacterium]